MSRGVPDQSDFPAAYPDTLKGRLAKGASAGLLGQLINLASRLLLPPLFLTAWGVDIYGEWLLLSSFVGYLALTDLGAQLYVVNRLTQEYARHDLQLFRKILHTGLALFLILPLLGFLIFVAIVLLVPPQALLQISETEHHVVLWALTILAFQFVVSLPAGILLGIYRSIGLLARGVMWGNLIAALQLGLIAGGLWLGFGIIGTACLQVLPYLLVSGMTIADIHRRYPNFLVLSLGHADGSIARTFIRPSLQFLSIQVAQIVSVQGTILVVGILLGPAQVVLFSTLRTIVNAMRQVLSLIANTTWPEMTRLDAEQNIDQLCALFRAILRTTMAIAAVLIGVLFFFGETIYRIWLGSAVEYSETLMNLFLVYAFQLVFWTACSNLLMAINRHQVLSRLMLCSSCVSLALAYVGGKYLDLNGLVIGMIAGDLLLPFWVVPYLLSKYQSWFPPMFFVRELAPIMGCLAFVVLVPWSAPLAMFLLFVWWLRCLPKRATVHSERSS